MAEIQFTTNVCLSVKYRSHWGNSKTDYQGAICDLKQWGEYIELGMGVVVGEM